MKNKYQFQHLKTSLLKSVKLKMGCKNGHEVKPPSQSFWSNKLTLENLAEYIDYSYVIPSDVEMLVLLLKIFLLYIRGELKET